LTLSWIKHCYEKEGPGYEIFYFRLDAAGFSTEIGLPSIPEIESIREMLPAENLWPINDMWGVHDYTNGNVKAYRFSGGIKSRFGKAESLEDFNRKARLLMMENYRAIFEAWGAQFGAEAGGVLLWMSHPAWPSFIFQLYDYYLNPSAAYFGTKKGCEPLHILWNNDRDTIHLVNTTQHSYLDLRAKAATYSINGIKAGEQESVVEIPAHTSRELFDLQVPGGISDVHFIKLTLETTEGEVLSDNFYWRSNNKKDFTQLDGLPVVSLTCRAKRKNGRIILKLENKNGSVALMARVKVTEEDPDLRVLPVFYSDNYISLLPGETRDITIDGIEGKEGLRLFIDGWNVLPTEISVE
jgi:hypothetical protein